ncbi:hypothetical protein, partial [Streptococcus sp. DD13]|uniref:hypothetical protein n=1 Tax=Streptococcus sp. DD13 TaxID=1777881 RepID=UPI00082D1ED7
MITEMDYKEIAEAVYDIDILNGNHTPRQGEQIIRKKYQLLATEDNTQNGMQAMAVAPVVDRKVDTSEIVIAYAGTNASDSKDLGTDLEVVVSGRKDHKTWKARKDSVPDADIGYAQDVYFPPALPREEEPFDYVEVPTHLGSAYEFADAIHARYPNSYISYTGHSLGGFLALIIAIKHQSPATVYNAPSPLDHLTEENLNFLKKNKDLYARFQVDYDLIGNFGTYDPTLVLQMNQKREDPLGITYRVPGRAFSPWGFVFDIGETTNNVMANHQLDNFSFNEWGQVIGASGQPLRLVSAEDIKRKWRFQQLREGERARFLSLGQLATRLKGEGGGLSQSERIYLDSEQAKALAWSLRKEIEEMEG